jgi:UDP-2-acetamido-3-amino-2,3-dideoxy-glucuronate N-acetyltransferase
VVTHDVPAHGLVIGAPARRVGWACQCGETLRGGGHAQCIGCGEQYEISDDAAKRSV